MGNWNGQVLSVSLKCCQLREISTAAVTASPSADQDPEHRGDQEDEAEDQRWQRHVDCHAFCSSACLDLLTGQMSITKLAYPSAQGARECGTGLVQLHHVSHVGQFRELELIGQPAEFGIRRLLFQPRPFECRPDVDE